jgi:hypothetical protein
VWRWCLLPSLLNEIRKRKYSLRGLERLDIPSGFGKCRIALLAPGLLDHLPDGVISYLFFHGHSLPSIAEHPNHSFWLGPDSKSSQ